MAGRFVTIDEAVAEASTFVPEATDEEKVLMRQWIYRAMTSIGFSKYNVQKSEEISLTSEFAIAKPADLVRTIDLSLFNSQDQELRINYKGWGKAHSSADEPEGRIHTDRRSVVNWLNVSEDSDYFYVQEFETSDATANYAYIKYYGVPVDDVESATPLPLIPIECVEACTAYVEMAIAKRRKRSIADRDLATREWKLERARARGKMKTPDPILGKNINLRANSLIQKLELEDRKY